MRASHLDVQHDEKKKKSFCRTVLMCWAITLALKGFQAKSYLPYMCVRMPAAGVLAVWVCGTMLMYWAITLALQSYVRLVLGNPESIPLTSLSFQLYSDIQVKLALGWSTSLNWPALPCLYVAQVNLKHRAAACPCISPLPDGAQVQRSAWDPTCTSVPAAHTPPCCCSFPAGLMSPRRL